jgi:hypothetical protein
VIPFVVEPPLNNSRTVSLGDVDCAVAAKGIEDDNIVTPFDGLETARKIHFLIQR